MPVEVGEEAPDFELRDQDNQPVRLSDYRGRKHVVLVFYPLSFTPTCSSELCSINDTLPGLVNDDVETLAVSVDSVFTHRVWAEQQGFGFKLLADFHPAGEVARRYGVWDAERGFASRGTFIIDRDGVVRWSVVSPVQTARDSADYARVLAGL